MNTVLYLGCPASERAATEKLLATANLSAVWSNSAAQALGELERRDMPVLLDLSRGAAALHAAQELRAHRAALLMFAVADTRRPDLTTEAVLAGMADVFTRPLAGRRVVNAIERALGHQSHDAGPTEKVVSKDLYHHSPAMKEVIALVARAATMRAGVMIRGEEGTGRQVVARAIHAARGDRRGQFVSVDCAAFGTEQLDAELFGAAARAGNGDVPSRGLERVGRNSRLHDALGGTLYLRNIAEASTRVQARLARILRDREAVLAGTNTAIPCDIRPVASIDPAADNAWRILDDLFRRLSVIRIDVPPLRNRGEDIPALANHFLREICAPAGMPGVPPHTLSRPALSLICALPWRGNAVELRSLLETVVTGRAGERRIGLEDVLAHVRLNGGAVVSLNTGTLRQARARFERDYIAAILERHHGRISDAAKALGVQRPNLYRKMRSLRLGRDRRGA